MLAYYTNQTTRRALARSEDEIEQRKRAEAELHVIWTMTPDGTLTYVSPPIMAVRRLTRFEAMQQTIVELFTPPSQTIALAIVWAMWFAESQEGLKSDEPWHEK